MTYRTPFPVLAVVLLAACASSPMPGSEMRPFTQTAPNSITLIVQNQNFADVRLYALRQAGRESLGVVTGLSDEEFTLDWSFSEPLRIEIDMLAGPSCTTEELTADPGDIFELQIAPVFTESRFCS